MEWILYYVLFEDDLYYVSYIKKKMFTYPPYLFHCLSLSLSVCML